MRTSGRSFRATLFRACAALALLATLLSGVSAFTGRDANAPAASPASIHAGNTHVPNVTAENGAANNGTTEDGAAHDGADPAEYVTESLRGRVVWMAEALERRFGIHTDPDAEHWLVALETPAGRLYPIVKDDRGRGFLIDPRLRDVDMELLVRRYIGSPMIQIIRVAVIKEDGKYELDYWCDVCSIPMYELKDCECCQGPIRLRERRIEGEP